METVPPQAKAGKVRFANIFFHLRLVQEMSDSWIGAIVPDEVLGKTKQKLSSDSFIPMNVCHIFHHRPKNTNMNFIFGPPLCAMVLPANKSSLPVLDVPKNWKVLILYIFH